MDMDKLNSLINQNEEDSNIFSSMVDKVVTQYSRDLDELMFHLREALTQEQPITTDVAERYFADLTNLLYFMVDKVEKLNVFSDLSRAKVKEVYNSAYLNFCSEKDEKGKSLRTVNENTALAESNSQYESTLNTIYDHAYKTLKMKIDMGLEMVSTLKNIIKRRISEDFLSSQLDNTYVKEVVDE